MISRSIYNLRIDTIYMYDIPLDRSFLQLSNGIRHVMPSTDRKLELKAKDIDDIDGSDRLTAGCVLTDLASPAVSQTAVYTNGLTFNLLTTTIVAPPSITSKWQMWFNLAFKGMREKPTNTPIIHSVY